MKILYKTININSIDIKNQLFMFRYITEKSDNNVFSNLYPILKEYNNNLGKYYIISGFNQINNTDNDLINVFVLQENLTDNELLILKCTKYNINDNDLLMSELIYKLKSIKSNFNSIISYFLKYDINHKDFEFYDIIWQYRDNLETIILKYGIDKQLVKLISDTKGKKQLFDLINNCILNKNEQKKFVKYYHHYNFKMKNNIFSNQSIIDIIYNEKMTIHQKKKKFFYTMVKEIYPTLQKNQKIIDDIKKDIETKYIKLNLDPAFEKENNQLCITFNNIVSLKNTVNILNERLKDV